MQFHAYTAPPPGHRPTPQAQSILRPSLGPGPLSPEMQLVEPGETEWAEHKRSAYRWLESKFTSTNFQTSTAGKAMPFHLALALRWITKRMRMAESPGKALLHRNEERGEPPPARATSCKSTVDSQTWGERVGARGEGGQNSILKLTCGNMDEPWTHYAKWISQSQKDKHLHDSTYLKYQELLKFTETQSRMVVTGWGWRGGQLFIKQGVSV